MEQDNDRISYEENAGNNYMKEVKEWAKAILVAVVLALLIRSFLFEIVTVDGKSMVPTLHDRERLFVNKIGYIIGEPERGDIIIFRTPEDNHTKYVKRLIALPGDRVRIENGVVYVNDEALDEPYILEPPRNDYAEVTVPEGTYFVLGDNRNDSKDTRDIRVGFIPEKNLIGKAKMRVWPLNDIKIIN